LRRDAEARRFQARTPKQRARLPRCGGGAACAAADGRAGAWQAAAALAALEELREKQAQQEEEARAAAQALGEREAELQAQCAAHVQQVKTLEAALAEVRAAGAADARAAGGGAGAELPDEFYCPITLSVMSDPVCPPSPPESWGSAPGLRAANDLLGPRSRHAPRAAS
jgi:multidrug efflux pump subunit AcrA (membrane-fusion protein)